MRTRQTFLLTVLTPENGSTSLKGKLKIISTGKTCTFTSLDELNAIISTEMKDEFYQPLSKSDHHRSSSDEGLQAT